MSLSNGMKVHLHMDEVDGCYSTAAPVAGHGSGPEATIKAYHPGSIPGGGPWYEAEITPGAVVALDPEDEGLSWHPDD